MPENKKKVCLNMIVKNEGHVIKETLESIYKYIDYYVINDTGSTDNTKEVIKEFFDEKGIDGEIVTHEFRTCTCHPGKWKRYSFFHFGWNRSYALKLCEGKSDYIFVMDADDLIVGDLKFPELTADCYMLRIGQGFTYQRALIFKNDPALEWHYVGALHEYPTSVKQNHSKIVIEGDYYMDSRRKGARSSDPQKYFKDAKVFEELIKEEPNNERYAFYCGQSYFDYKDYSNAIKWYKRRIELKGWFEEVFYSYFRIAQAKESLGHAWPEVEKAYFDAYNYCKERSEPIYHIAKYYRLNNQFEKAYTWAKKGSKIPYPKNCSLFIYKDIYDYRMWDELGLDAFYTGKFKESYSIYKRLLDEKLVPNQEIKRVSDNLKMVSDKLDKQNKGICCIYTGDIVVSNQSSICKILNSINDIYNIILVGDKIDMQSVNPNTVVMTTNFFRSLDKKKIDYLILYDSINYYYENFTINPKHTVIILNSSLLKLSSDNGINIFINNSDYLNKVFKKLNIKKIVCINNEIKNLFIKEYNLQNDTVDSFSTDGNKVDSNIIFDETTFTYKFDTTLNNDTNGFIFSFSPSIEKLIENRDVYDFAKQQLYELYESMIKKFSDIPEIFLNFATINLTFNDYIRALTNLDHLLNTNNKKNKALDHTFNNKIIDHAMMIKAQILNRTGNYYESYNIANEVMDRSNIPENMRMLYEETRDLNVDYIKDTTLIYSHKKVNNVIKSLENINIQHKIMLTVTTCKRFDLFEKTINSFLNCCKDLEKISHWLCVDDNSSQEDRLKMKKLYPFFTFILKDETQKGHFISMNMIREEAIKNNMDYILHMEDDWHYVNKRNYITDAIKILEENDKIGQVLFNKNYSEVEFSKRKIPGGILNHTKDGMRYVIHEHYEPDSREYKQFQDRHKGFGTCGYWPHFSFRPSVVRVSMLKDIGPFYNTGHFEMAYANEYKAHGYKSAFFDTFSCIHTGKKTWEKDGINSYHLNKTGQFTLNNNEFVSNYIISESKDIQVWKKFKINAIDKLPYFTRHIPRNVKGLNDFEKHIFCGNEFNYLRPILDKIAVSLDILRGCNSQYLVILRENVLPNTNFAGFINYLKDEWEIEKQEYEFISLDKINENSEDYLLPVNIYPINLERMNGCIISRTGIKKILSYVTGNRVKNLDYLQNFSGMDTFILNKWIVDPQEPPKELEFNIQESYKVLEGYQFYSQMDSFGEDIGWVGQKTPDELKSICEEKSGICFNTLGYVKHKVNPEKDFIYLPNSTKTSEGLYVKCS